MFTNQRTILHIDDDPAVTRLVAQLLGEAGYEVESINSPREAMEALEQGQHRLVLLDIDMAERSGMLLLSEIKAHDAGIQVIMLTGLVSVTTVLETMRSGAEACLFKPIDDPEPLLDAVADAFKRVDRCWFTLRELTQRRKQEQSLLESTEAELAAAD